MKNESRITLCSDAVEKYGFRGSALVLFEVLRANSTEDWAKMPYEQITLWAGDGSIVEHAAELERSGAVKFRTGEKGEVLYKIEKNSKKRPARKTKSPIFLSHMLEMGIREDLAYDYLKVREQKKGVDTETAWNKLSKQMALAKMMFGYSPEDCIRTATERNWVGFEAEWLSNIKKDKPQPQQAQNGVYTMKDGTTMMCGKRYYTSIRDNKMHECPVNAPDRPSRYFEYSYSRMSWEVING